MKKNKNQQKLLANIIEDIYNLDSPCKDCRQNPCGDFKNKCIVNKHKKSLYKIPNLYEIVVEIVKEYDNNTRQNKK